METTLIPTNETNLSQWFDKLVSSLVAMVRSDQLLIETKVADKDTMTFYNALRNEDNEKLTFLTKQNAIKSIIGKLLFDYMIEIKSSPARNVLKLAVDHTDSKILVWAEINDDDDDTERAIILTEAKVNANYYSKGLTISSIITEKSDNYPIPKHYKQILPVNA